MANNIDTEPMAPRWISATIAGSSTTSSRVDLKPNEVPVAFLTDSGFDGTTFTFTVCDTSGGTYVAALKNDASTALGEMTGAASKLLWIEPAQAAGLGPHFKIVAASQTGDTTIKILVRKLH